MATIVDSHNYILLQLVDFIGESFLWGSKQYISLWRALEDDSIEITTDEHLSEWFELNKDNGVVHIVGQINDFDGPLQFSPNKRRFHPTVLNFTTLTPSTPPIDLDRFIDPTQPTQPTNELAKEGKKPHRKVTDDEEECKHSDTEFLAALSEQL